MLRYATLEDAQALLDIYAPYIATPISFEYDVPSVEEFRGRIQDISQGYPYLVYEENGKILGYAYAHRHMERAAYQWNAETTIYLREDVKRQGIGRLLYTTLLDILRLQGIRIAYGCITYSNEASLRFHKALGFTEVGVFREAGYKDGAWRDIAWYEKILAPHDPEPAPFVPLGDVDKETIEELLARSL